MDTNVLTRVDIKHLLHIQDDFRDIFYRIMIVSMAFLLYIALDYPRRIVRKTIEKYIELLEAMKVRFKFTQNNEYSLVKKVLYEQKTRHEQNIIAATLKMILEEDLKIKVTGISQQEKLKQMITMENKMTLTDEEICPPEQKSISPRVRNRSLCKSTFTTRSRSSSVSTTASSYTTHMSSGNLSLKNNDSPKIKRSRNENLPKINKSKKTEIKATDKGTFPLEKCEDIAEYVTTRPSSGMHNMPVMFPATIVANCEVKNVLFGVIQDFNSKTFPFFDQKWHDSENLNENHGNDYKYNTPIFKCPFPNKCHSNSYIPIISKKNIDDKILNKNVKTCKSKCVTKDNSKDNISKESETLQTCKELNDYSNYTVNCLPKSNVVGNNIKNTQGLVIAPFLQPKYWFYRKEIWNQRCKYIIKSAVQNQKQREHLYSIFSKNELLRKPSNCLRKKIKMVKNKEKNTPVNQIFKSNDIVLKNDKKNVKLELNSNYKINNSDSKIPSKMQNIIQMSLHEKKIKIDSHLKEMCCYIDKKEKFKEENNGKVSNCEPSEQKLSKFNEVDTGINCYFKIHDRSKNSSNDNVNDECFFMEELNGSVSGSDIYTTDKNYSEDSNKNQITTNIRNKTNIKSYCKPIISNLDYCMNHKRNNLDQWEETTEINLTSKEKDFQCVKNPSIQPKVFCESSFSNENLPQNKYERGQSLDNHNTLKECCEQETLQKINKVNNLAISRATLVSYESSVKNNRLDLLEEINNDYKMGLILTPSGSYKENDTLEGLGRIDKDGDLGTIIPGSKNYESCAESDDRVKLIEEINNNTNLVISKPISGGYGSCEEKDKLEILEGIDKDNSLDISIPASGNRERYGENDKLEHIKEIDGDSFLVINRLTSRGYGSCEESEKLEVEDEDNNFGVSRPVSGGYESCAESDRLELICMCKPNLKTHGMCEESDKLNVLAHIVENNNLDIYRSVSGNYKNYTESNRLEFINEINEDSNLGTSGSYENCEKRVELLEKLDKEDDVGMCRLYSRSCESHSKSDSLQELLPEIDEEGSLGISTPTSGNYENCAKSSRLNDEEIDEESDLSISTDLKNPIKSNVVQPTSCDGLYDCFNSANLDSAKSLSKYQQNKFEEVENYNKAYIIKPTVSTIKEEEIADETGPTNSESALTSKILEQTLVGLTGSFSSEKKLSNSPHTL